MIKLRSGYFKKVAADSNDILSLGPTLNNKPEPIAQPKSVLSDAIKQKINNLVMIES
jgi:hypothetical protein